MLENKSALDIMLEFAPESRRTSIVQRPAGPLVVRILQLSGRAASELAQGVSLQAGLVR